MADPARKLRTLEGFAQTETRGGLDIAAAAERAQDDGLRRSLERHAQDELRHGELFRQHAAALRARGDASREREEASRPTGAESAPPPSASGPEVDEHGFFEGHAFDDVGDVAFIAMLHVAERRASAFFKKLRREIRDDDALAAILDEVLRDEVRHVGYTRACLEEWSREGRHREVREALALARGKRALGAWGRWASRIASRGGRVFTFLLYYTVAAPFGLIARFLHRERHGWQPPRGRRDAAHLRSQF